MSMLVLTMLGVAAVAVAGGGFASDVVEALKSSKQIYVGTRRADGSLSAVVPVWFIYDGEVVYSTSAPGAHKVRRIRKGSPLEVWVGRTDGPHFVGRAEILASPELAARLGPLYSAKYWIAWLGFFRPDPGRVRAGKTVIIKIHPPGG